MINRKYKSWLSLIIILAVAGCDSTWTIDLSKADQTSSPIIAPSQLYDSWITVTEGVEFKQVLVTEGSSEELLDIVRIDPTIASISFHVSEEQPATVSDWQEQLGATVVINGSYFDDNYQLVTRTQTDVDEAGPLLTGNTGYVYQTSSGWEIGATPAADTMQLLQSYPMLVADGQASVEDSTADSAQRTIIATNTAGVIYFIVAEYGVLNLKQLSHALANIDQPELDMALNLDGGSSTGLAIASSSVNYLDDSFLVPSVVAIR